VWYFTTSQLRSTFMPLICFGGAAPGGGALLGLRVKVQSCDESVFYNKARVRKKNDPLRRRSVVFQRNYIRKPLPGPLSPPDLSCSVWFHHPVLFCRVVCSLPLVVSTLPNP
jgi:hypothetical protein